MGSISQASTVSVLMGWPAHTRSSRPRGVSLAALRRKASVPPARRVARGTQAQGQRADVELVAQPQRQIGQRLQHRIAVELEPKRGIDRVDAGLDAGERLDAALHRQHEVDATDFLQRPARGQPLRVLARHIVQAFAHHARLLAHDGQKARAHGGIQVGVVEHFSGRTQVRQRAAAALGQAVQELHTRAFGLVFRRDVVEHQHEAGDRCAALAFRCVATLSAHTADATHRGHLRAQQLARARGGDELGARIGRAATDALLHALERVCDQVAVEDRVDGAAEADHLGPVGQRRGVGQRAELHARPVVVEQDAAVEVAHHHALRELAHQRGQTVALFGHAAAGARDLGGHLAAQRVALPGQRVEQLRQALHVRTRARRLQRHLGVGGEQHARLLQQARRRCQPAPVARCCRGGGRADAGRGHHQQQRGARAQHFGQRLSLGCFQRAPHQQAAAAAHAEQQRRRRGRTGAGPDQQAPVAPHSRSGAASSSRTACASSWIEKGLLT